MKQLYFSLKTFFIAGLLMVLLPLAQDARAQITLAKGDIAFIRVNETTTDAFSIVALANLPAGTNIYFTDNSWGNGAWNGDEGHFLYTVQAGGITAGTVVHFDELSADVLTVTGGSSGTITKSNTGGTGGFSIAGGDQVIAYQSSTGVKPASPFFIAAINTDDGGAVQTSGGTMLSNEVTGWVSPSNWDLSTKGSQASVLPSGLTNGTDAVGMFPQAGGGAWTSKEVNNMRYDCAKGTSGSKAAMLAKINDPANWVFNDPTPYATSTVCASFTVSSAPATPSPSSNTPVCTGNTINLTTAAVAGATYSWTGPNGFSSSLQNPSINNATAAMAGTYSVTVTTNGCTSTAGTTAVVVNAKPATPSPSSNTPVCTGNTINLSTPAVAGATYSWTGPNSFSSSLQNPSINNATAAMAGTYSVTVTTNGCTSTAGTTAVVVNTAPTANNDALTVLGNSAATVVDVLANDQANTLGQTLTVTAITQPANGTATLIAGVVRYTPATGFSGNTSFTYTIAGSICGTSTATVNVTVSPDPLPVTIAKGLTLKKEADGVRLTWTTASETNNSKFIIYRGGNDTQLAELKMIDGKINSSVLQDYSFLDSHPLIGVNYYRLAQVDLDGKKSILGEKAIEYQIAHPELAVYPNPTTGKITLDFAPKKYQKVQLTSIHGSVLMEQTISSSSSQCSFEMSRLPAGTYLIRLSGTGGVLHSKVVRK